MHMLSGYISADLLATESESALHLSERLSGHALALSNMCGLIHRRSWTIAELLEVYDRSNSFQDGLDVVWKLSFEDLQPDSTALLSLLSLFAPGSIPPLVLQPSDIETVEHSMSLQLYQDHDRYVKLLISKSATNEETDSRTLWIIS